MKLKSKIVSTILSMALSLGVMGFAVYAAATQTLIVNNTVSFVSNHVLATVTGEISGAKNANAFGAARKTTATGDGSLAGALGEWNIGETVEFEQELQPILITLTITNDSKERYFTFELEFANEVEESDNIIRTVSYTSVSEGQATGGTYTPVAALRVDAEAEAKIVVSLTIADTGKSVTNFNNNFSVTLRNLGTVDPVEPEEPGEPTTGDFVYNPQNKTVTVTEEKEISYLNMPEVANDTENAFFGFFTEPTHQNKVVLPYTLKPNETLYAKTGTLPEGLLLGEQMPHETFYKVVGYVGNEETLIIPETYENMHIREIDINAFENNQVIKTIDISSIYSIGWGAFAHSSIETLIAPNVQSVGPLAFQYTHQLTSLSFPKMIYVGQEGNNFGSFENASGLVSIFLPNAEEVNTQSFKNTQNLLSLDLPKVKKVGRSAFEGTEAMWDPMLNDHAGGWDGPVSQLHTVNLPAVERIDENAFDKAVNLTTLNTPEFVSLGKGALSGAGAVLNYDDESGLMFYKNILVQAMGFFEEHLDLSGTDTIAIADGVFDVWYSDTLKTVSLPTSLYHIGAKAFSGNYELHTINLDHVRTIENEAFQNTKLQTINLTSAEIIGESAFEVTRIGSFPSITNVIGGANLQNVGVHAFNNNMNWFNTGLVVLGGTYVLAYNGEAPAVLEIPAGVVRIGQFALHNQEQPTTVNLPSSVTHINAGAFAANVNLTSINLESVVFIGENAFDGANLSSINLANAEYIGMSAFANNNLTSISMPKVQEIGYDAFTNNLNLTTVTLPSTLKKYESAFNNISTFTLIIDELNDKSALETFWLGQPNVLYIAEGNQVEQTEMYPYLMSMFVVAETDMTGYLKLERI